MDSAENNTGNHLSADAVKYVVQAQTVRDVNFGLPDRVDGLTPADFISRILLAIFLLVIVLLIFGLDFLLGDTVSWIDHSVYYRGTVGQIASFIAALSVPIVLTTLGVFVLSVLGCWLGLSILEAIIFGKSSLKGWDLFMHGALPFALFGTPFVGFVGYIMGPHAMAISPVVGMLARWIMIVQGSMW